VDWERARAEWQRFQAGSGDNSFFVWQWVSVGLVSRLIHDGVYG